MIRFRDLALGRVTPEGIDLNFLTFPVEEIFYRFIVYKEWDVSEISMAKYVLANRTRRPKLLGPAGFSPSRVFPSFLALCTAGWSDQEDHRSCRPADWASRNGHRPRRSIHAACWCTNMG